MTAKYEHIQKIALSAPASSVVFTSLSQQYKHLEIVINYSNSSTAGSSIGFRYNSDSGSNYPYIGFYATPTVTFSDGTESYAFTNYSASTVDQLILAQIFDYSETSRTKSTLARSGGGNYRTYGWYSAWNNNSAITNIEVLNTATNFNAGATFDLYGINGDIT